MTPLRYHFKSRLSEAQLAMMMLTRFPVGRINDPVPSASAACWAFPLAGAAVGLVISLVLGCALRIGLPAEIAVGLALATGVIATGGLHEDGLADVADGFGGGQTRERKLEIMRDSRIGSYGTLALILMIGLRWSAMTTLTNLDPEKTLFAIVGIAIISRSVLPLLLTGLPPARLEGLGQSASNPGTPAVTASVTFGLLALMLLVGARATLVISLSQVAAVLLIGRLSFRQIGGQTGDVLGAIQQVADLCAWIAVLLIVAP